MNKLFRSSSSVSSRSMMSSIPDIINQEEHSYENISQEVAHKSTLNKFTSQLLLIIPCKCTNCT